MNLLAILLKLVQNPSLNATVVALANQTLELIVPQDIDHNEDFKALSNKKVLVSLSDAQLHYTLNFSSNSIAIVPAPTNEATLAITTNSTSLQALVNKTTDIETLTKAGSLTITGDKQLLIHLVNLSVKIDYSLENVLAKYVGDVPAYFLSRAGEQAVHVGKSLVAFVQGATGGTRESEIVTNEDAFRDDSLNPMNHTQGTTSSNTSITASSNSTHNSSTASIADSVNDANTATTDASPTAQVHTQNPTNTTTGTPLDILSDLPTPDKLVASVAKVLPADLPTPDVALNKLLDNAPEPAKQVLTSIKDIITTSLNTRK